jgi:two-component system LytT family sensor kinase
VAQVPAFLSPHQSLLITLIVKLAAILALAIMLVRYHRFRDILISEQRSWKTRLVFAASLGIPLAAGVGSRLLLRYDAADLTLEGALLAGLVTGSWSGALVGLAAGSAAAAGGEYLALPFAVGCGVVGGVLREVCPKEEIWRLSTFVLLDLHTYAWRFVRRLRIDWQVVLVAAPIGLELVRQAMAHRWPGQLFHPPATTSPVEIIVVLTTVIGVTAPIRIWNNARIEHRLVEQEKLLMRARIDALTSQINPHFLFNTLTSISSLVRSDPDTARLLIGKLSSHLRRRLKAHDPFVTLRAELASVDEYLDIEIMRFGDRLRVEKHIDPDTLDLVVPGMILQPLVENSIKHGISKQVEGGCIVIRAGRQADRLMIEVEDNGPGMSPAQIGIARHAGIGLNNVSERLRVIYGAAGSLRLTSEPGRRTVARIDLPETLTGEGASN